MQAHGIPLNGLDGDTLRVLVVDDEPDALELLKDMLASNSKYEVQTAINGFEGGMMAERFRPHVILLDLMLTDVDGREVCKNIKQNPNLTAVKVVAVSGQLTTRQGQKLLAEGFDGFLSKPFDLNDVFHVVEEASNLAR